MSDSENSDTTDVPKLTKKELAGLKRLSQLCKVKTEEEDDIPDMNKTRSLRNIAKKMKLNNEGSKASGSKTASQPRLVGNRNAAKKTRTIEVGWTHNGVVMGAKKGGTARKFCIRKGATGEGIIEAAVSYFFPGGKSKKGLRASACKFRICDFSHEELEPEQTVEDVYKRSSQRE